VNFSSLGHHWFALQVRTRSERFCAALLRQKGYIEFVPLVPNIGAHNRAASKGRLYYKVLYPGYIFCKFDPTIHAHLVTTAGVIRIVGNGRTPLPISDQEIVNIQLIVASGIPTYDWPFLKVGDQVRIEGGPLRGAEGILIQQRCTQRLIVSIDILGRSTAVELFPSWVSSAVRDKNTVFV
jgi:transcription antitermination factor NusG